VPRLVGIETEFAIQFLPTRPGDPRPSHEDVFRAILAALKTRVRSCEALYYKGGDFLENGSLIHFEVGRLDDPSTGLLEWASPECLSAKELLGYLKAQEKALTQAIPDAEVALAAKGHEGRIVALKNNRDRFGNDYGTHESYDANEREIALWRRLTRRFLHPLVLVLLILAAIVAFLPFVAILLLLLVVLIAIELVGLITPLRPATEAARARLGKAAAFLLEAGPARFSGLFPYVFLNVLRVAALVFSQTARVFMFRGHLPQILPFLVTRQVFAGPGWLAPDGRYQLSARAHALRRTVSAYNFGVMRPIVDLKEYFYFRPLSHAATRKRLHLLVGDANRCEYAEWLKIATTAGVLDAIEAGAIDAVAASFTLLGGPLGALRATASDPRLVRPVARDRKTGKPLTALDVQRRYLEATWEHHRSLGPAVEPEARDALVRWSFVLDQLGQGPQGLDRELDWVLKKRILDRTLEDALPGVELEAAWDRIVLWGSVNAALEAKAPEEEFPGELVGPAVLEVLRAKLGPRRVAKLARRLPPDVAWTDFPAVRRAWLRLKVVDLRYHELSREGGYYDWFQRDGLVARELTAEEIARAETDPPQKTRARIRGDFVKKAPSYRACKVGWDRVVIEPRGEPKRTISLADPYRFELA
jgi:proteasome accessory factor A